MKISGKKSQLKTSIKKGKKYYNCLIRDRLISKTPEESVRQQLILYLLTELEVPKENLWIEGSLRAIFPEIKSNRRVDLMIFNDRQLAEGFVERDIIALFECKKPGKPIDDTTLEQLESYNIELGAQYYVITNSKETFVFFINLKNDQIEILDKLPKYKDMIEANNQSIITVGFFDDRGNFISYLTTIY